MPEPGGRRRHFCEESGALRIIPEQTPTHPPPRRGLGCAGFQALHLLPLRELRRAGLALAARRPTQVAGGLLLERGMR